MIELYQYKATVEKVNDGDTLTALIDLGFNLYHRTTIRLLGIDTPEVKKYSGRYKYEEEIQIGKEIGRWVSNRILNKNVLLKTEIDKTDVYGRVLAHLYYKEGDEWIHLNQQMIDLGFNKKNIQEKLESSTTIEIPA